MGNQGNVERNSKVCVEVQTMKIIHDIQFWVFLFSISEGMRSNVRQKKIGELEWLL